MPRRSGSVDQMRSDDAGREVADTGSATSSAVSRVQRDSSLPTALSLCHFICNYLAVMPCEGTRPPKGLGVHLSALTRAALHGFAFRFGC